MIENIWIIYKNIVSGLYFLIVKKSEPFFKNIYQFKLNDFNLEKNRTNKAGIE